MLSKTLKLNSQLDNVYFLKGDAKDEIYLYAELKAAKAAQEKERAPLNISVVLDRSGSMAGDKLNYVKKATNFIVDNLNKNDRLSIVQYDTRIDVVAASANIQDKSKLQQKINDIHPGGSTNLSGGMQEGYSQVRSTKAEGFVNRTLLLSDGLANAGITDPKSLQQIAQNNFRNHGVGLSTFGVGEGFNEELMTALAEYGGANYYFIASPDEIPQIFAEELQGLLSVVAQNTKLSIDFPSAYLSCERVYGYLHEMNGERITINFNDVFSEEEKAIVIKFKIKKPLDHNLRFNMSLVYDDVVSLMDRYTLNQSLDLVLTHDQELYEAGLNKEALENVALFVSNDHFTKVMRLVDQRKFKEAKQLCEKAKVYLETHIKLFPTSEQLRNQLEQINEYLLKIPNLEKMQQYDRAGYSMVQKSMRSANYKLSKRKF
ncbi:MAG: VWA domain-containing protein [Saprospiraceae bacterium]|nr:VWA domain-containing protein [Saprospiraceae bacterium]